jgi:hypothetical protein
MFGDGSRQALTILEATIAKGQKNGLAASILTVIRHILARFGIGDYKDSGTFRS